MAGFCAGTVGLHGRSANPGPAHCGAACTFFAVDRVSAVSHDAISSGRKAAGGYSTSNTHADSA